MARSLLDRVDLGRVRAAAAEQGPGRVLVACLFEGGILQHDPDDPSWPDRDRIVVGGGGLAGTVASWFTRAGHEPQQGKTGPLWWDVGPGAVGFGYGLSLASAGDGAVWRVYCLVDAETCEQGPTWEAAAAAGAARVPLTVPVIGADRPSVDRAAALFEAASWPLHVVPVADIAALLGALDRALSGEGPAAVVLRP